MHKFAWQVRRTRSAIDYIIINNSNIEDTRVSRGREIDSDRKLLESNLPFPINPQPEHKRQKTTHKTLPWFKVHLFQKNPYENCIETDWKENSH